MKMSKNIMITSMLIALSAPAMAQVSVGVGADTAINNRSVNQQSRIDAGVNSGGLNANESANLQARQNAINNRIGAVEADGVVTAPEARSINRQERRQSARIAAKKRNARMGAGAAAR